jgi:hypothetical protein
MTNSIFPYNILVLSNSVENKGAVNYLSSWKAIGYKLTAFLSENVTRLTQGLNVLYMLPLPLYEFTCIYVNIGLCRKLRSLLRYREQLNIINNVFILQEQSWRCNIWPCSRAVGVLSCPFPMDVISVTCFDLIRAFIHSFIHQWLYSHLLGPGLFFSFVIFFTQTVGLLGRVISPSQGRYLHTGQHKHRINAYTHQTSMPWMGFEPTIPASELAKKVHALDRAANATYIVLRFIVNFSKFG